MPPTSLGRSDGGNLHDCNAREGRICSEMKTTKAAGAIWNPIEGGTHA